MDVVTLSNAVDISADPGAQRGGRVARKVCVVLAVLVLSSVAQSWATDVYRFEQIQLNTFIHGQDNWIDQPEQGDGIVVLDTTPENGTRVVAALPTTAFNEPVYLTRVNDGSFAFPPYTGAETDAVLQFDVTGDHIAYFALGHDINGDRMLKINDGEVGCAFGTDDRTFAIRQAAGGATFAAAFGSGNAGRDWYRLQLRIDFTANGGDGSGSLFYLNLTDGDPVYQPITGLQDVNLMLSSMAAGAGVETWDAMWLLVLRGGGNSPTVDNLVPVVQEPSEAAWDTSASPVSRLSAVAPNPFRGEATIRFRLPDAADVSLGIYDAGGRLVRELLSGSALEASRHEIAWDGRNESGQALAPGVYFYRLQAGRVAETRKVTIMK